MKKIIYLTVPSYFDLEISLIRELSKIADVQVLLILSPISMNSSAFSIKKMKSKCDIIKATEYEELSKYDDMIDRRRWHIVNNPNNSIVSSFKLAKKISNFVSNGNFDILHCTTSCKTSFYLLFFLPKHVKKIFTVHDPIPHQKLSFFRNIVVDLFYKFYGNLLLLSNSHIKVFEKKLSRIKHKIFFSKLGIYDFYEKYEIKNNKIGKYILFFGRILPYKGVDVLIESYLRSNAQKLGVKLVIAGKGNISSDYELNENIITLNRYITNDEISNLITHSLFVVLPYKSATQSGVAMSAFAFNKPIVATNVGDLPNIIIDGYNGLIVPACDSSSLIKAIDRLFYNNQLLEKFSDNIKLDYQNGGEKSWTKIVDGLLDIYNSL